MCILCVAAVCDPCPEFSVDWVAALDAFGSLHACFGACVPLCYRDASMCTLYIWSSLRAGRSRAHFRVSACFWVVLICTTDVVLHGIHRFARSVRPEITIPISTVGVARPGGPESSLFGSGLRASGRGLTLEVLRWHGVDMYIEQLTHEDFTQTTRSAPVTAATTWTLLHQSTPCTGAVRKHTLRCMSRYSRALATVPR